MHKWLLLSVSLSVICYQTYAQDKKATYFKDITLIDGSGNAAQPHVNLLINADTIVSVISGNHIPPNAKVIDMSGKTVMPLLISGHEHLGLLKGNTSTADNYTRENVIRQLKRYLHYGVGTVLSLGTDQPLVFALRDSSGKGLIPGATILTAGYGFGVKGGSPPPAFGQHTLRPETPEQAISDVDKLAILQPDFIKIWVDDGGGSMPKVAQPVYEAIIKEAHEKGLKVAAHVYFLEDARQLVNAGIDLLAHSIRDKEVDAALITAMKEKGVFYIPTLALDEYGFIYAGQPEWINDPFFIRSLEPGVWDMITSDVYKKEQQEDKNRGKKMRAFMTAVVNLRKLDSAGVKIAMGTDAGAFPVRAQGFSEHLELQLMVEAGLSPLKVISCATLNGATLLGIEKHTGTLVAGKKADFMILDGDPSQDINNTRHIVEVWKNGKKAE
ncbi:Imidazolonepropionase [Chitinophaga sp. CF118]|uniref:amidohydrolase family protein n=1 Tax=Chitinophaga sp. CF118 TaxID=1884367 RepID=UPI0008E3DBCA|nr:amidohydrolase family protein [Chitinophaga sp. CF118]SFE54843.1 Imidazolonepropionase [Chitinophaga sp. CF118]